MFYIGLSLFTPVSCLAIHTLISVLVLHRTDASPQKTTVRVCMISCFFTLAVAIGFLFKHPVENAVWTLVYVGINCICFSYCYFHLFNMSETSRRIHILMGIYEDLRDGNKTMTAFSRYHPVEMVEERIDRAVKLGIVYEKEGRLFARRGLLYLAAVFFSQLRRLLFREVF